VPSRPSRHKYHSALISTTAVAQLPDDLSLHAGATITLHGGVTFINPSIDDFFKRNK
jgi:hypothetical protein